MEHFPIPDPPDPRDELEEALAQVEQRIGGPVGALGEAVVGAINGADQAIQTATKQVKREINASLSATDQRLIAVLDSLLSDISAHLAEQEIRLGIELGRLIQTIPVGVGATPQAPAGRPVSSTQPGRSAPQRPPAVRPHGPRPAQPGRRPAVPAGPRRPSVPPLRPPAPPVAPPPSPGQAGAAPPVQPQQPTAMPTGAPTVAPQFSSTGTPLLPETGGAVSGAGALAPDTNIPPYPVGPVLGTPDQQQQQVPAGLPGASVVAGQGTAGITVNEGSPEATATAQGGSAYVTVNVPEPREAGMIPVPRCGVPPDALSEIVGVVLLPPDWYPDEEAADDSDCGKALIQSAAARLFPARTMADALDSPSFVYALCGLDMAGIAQLIGESVADPGGELP